MEKYYEHITKMTDDQLADMLRKRASFLKKLSFCQTCELTEIAGAMEEAARRLN